MAKITFFSAPKPFEQAHITLIQRNAIQSWVHLGAAVEVILLGNEAGIAETALEFGVRHIAEIERNAQGTPRLDSIFQKAGQAANSSIMAYLNSDIITLPDFVQTALDTASQREDYLIVGQRWDLDLTRALEFSAGWPENLLRECRDKGRRHPRGGSDYFIYPRGKFQNLPSFALGRAGWDNWMIYEGRQSGAAVIDASGAINIIHQTHDYHHLPGGKPHYKLPESFDNMRMAGGKNVIFNLDDASSIIEDGTVKPFPSTWRKFWREVEIAPRVRLKSNFLAQLSDTVFHPVKTAREVRAWLAGVKKKFLKTNG